MTEDVIDTGEQASGEIELAERVKQLQGRLTRLEAEHEKFVELIQAVRSGDIPASVKRATEASKAFQESLAVQKHLMAIASECYRSARLRIPEHSFEVHQATQWALDHYPESWWAEELQSANHEDRSVSGWIHRFVTLYRERPEVDEGGENRLLAAVVERAISDAWGDPRHWDTVADAMEFLFAVEGGLNVYAPAFDYEPETLRRLLLVWSKDSVNAAVSFKAAFGRLCQERNPIPMDRRGRLRSNYAKWRRLGGKVLERRTAEADDER